jgi:sialidase-1
MILPLFCVLCVLSRLGLFLFLSFLCFTTAILSAASTPSFTDVFIAGTDGYHTYRIPASVVTTNGTLLAFCEGRKNSPSDTGKIDLLLKRSTDGGKTWGAQQIVRSDRDNVCGNPAPVVDITTGVIWLLMTWNLGADGEREINNGTSMDTRRIFVTHSADDGVTWATPQEITASVKKSDWRWYATGPVNGIQLTRGEHKGRLVIPCNHTELDKNGKSVSRSHVIYSDDRGATWQLGGIEDELTNESTIVECADGLLLQNMRSYHKNNRRAVATSNDAGANWSPVKLDEALIEPVCQGSIHRYSWPENGGRSRILFSNPASTKRENLILRLSYDEGATWPVSKVIHAGPSAYSCLAVLPDKSIACLLECGEKSAYEKISLARIPLDWLENDWYELPQIPDPIGFAAPFAGTSSGALVVAGGANFPGAMPWEGGRKVWYDSIFVLPKPQSHWLTGFKLPHAIAYGVSVSTPEGVLCAGGSDAHQHFHDVFLLSWKHEKIEIRNFPPLPRPMANGCGALIGNTFYLAGGIEKPEATNALHTFWSIDISQLNPAWKELEPWPGPARMLAVAGASDGAFFLFSGVGLSADAAGKPVRRYLNNAYRFVPREGWKRISDLPRAAVGAPSPAVRRNGQLLIVGGDDGTQVNFEPKSAHPGFPKDILSYDPSTDRWTRLNDSPLSRANAPVVEWNGMAVIPNGETKPGYRTPEVWALKPQ